jgi:transposase
MRHYEHLKVTRVQQSVYEQSSEAAIVKASIREVIATIDDQIAQVEREIRQHFDDHSDLRRKRDLLTSIPGIGETTGGSLLSEIPHLDRFESESRRRVCWFIATTSALWDIDPWQASAL